MELHSPLIITSRLMPGLQIGAATISLDIGPRTSAGRTVYQCFIDLPEGYMPREYEVTDLRSGCQGGSIQDGLSALLSFLGAAAESRHYRESTDRQSENEDLFPVSVVDWAAENADEIGMLAYELEEGPTLVAE